MKKEDWREELRVEDSTERTYAFVVLVTKEE